MNTFSIFTKTFPSLWHYQDLRQLAMAHTDDPKGGICSFCSKPNDFADDCGFFYISPTSSITSQPCCRRCWFHRRPGKLHIARYGLGER
jgi:hypothetical protein